MIAGGLLVGVLGGAVAGMASGGLVGTLLGLSVPEEARGPTRRGFTRAAPW
ncbi:MAG: hypothetical protein U0736_16000 [Gemmataceae bacterium]